MVTLALALIVFSLAVLLLSLGSLLGGRRIEGSCGGIGRLAGIESDCSGTCTGRSCPRAHGPKPHRGTPREATGSTEKKVGSR